MFMNSFQNPSFIVNLDCNRLKRVKKMMQKMKMIIKTKQCMLEKKRYFFTYIISVNLNNIITIYIIFYYNIYRENIFFLKKNKPL